MKKVFSMISAVIFLSVVFAAGIIGIPVNAYNLDVSPTSSPVYVNGEIRQFESYNINGSNYFKLRDIAYCLSGSEGQFGVDWSEASRAINITLNAPYEPIGGECSLVPLSTVYSITVSPSAAAVYVNGRKVSLDSYNINGSNYFKLRSLGDNLNFGVDWSEELQSVIIFTNDKYRNVNSNEALSEFAEEVVRLVNIEREKNNLQPLTLDKKLSEAAAVRANECNTLFSHTRPDGTSCFTILDEMNIRYGFCGENIAIGQRTPEEAVTGWMNSKGHRENILNPSYNKIGVGAAQAEGGSYRTGYAWAQLFTN